MASPAVAAAAAARKVRRVGRCGMRAPGSSYRAEPGMPTEIPGVESFLEHGVSDPRAHGQAVPEQRRTRQGFLRQLHRWALLEWRYACISDDSCASLPCVFAK